MNRPASRPCLDPAPDGLDLVCTKDAGHDGWHEAQGPDGEVLGGWLRESPLWIDAADVIVTKGQKP